VAQGTTSSTEESRPRRWLPLALVVLASIIGLVSVFALWAKRQLLETETWTDTSTELLANEDISNAVADFLSTELFAHVDVQAALEERLPPPVQPLAAPVAGGLRQLGDRAAREALQQPAVQGLWEDANRAAHTQLLKLLEDEGEFVSTTGGTVTLDLTGIASQVATQVGLPSSLVSKIPPEAANLEVLRSDQLEAAQTGVDLLKTLAYVLTGLTLLLYALAIILARGRRRETLRAVGFGFIAVGALVLFGRGAAGNAVVASLASTTAAEPPVEATFEIGTSLLKETGQSLILYGIAIVIAAWIAGPTAIASYVRDALAPYLRQKRFAYGGVAVLLALLFWWDPVVATHRFVPSLLLIVLLVLGVEMLRRQVIREFPERVTSGSSEGIAQRMATRMREGRERRVAPAPAGGPGEDRVSALERLAALHNSGVLSDDELAAEKRRILE